MQILVYSFMKFIYANNVKITLFTILNINIYIHRFNMLINIKKFFFKISPLYRTKVMPKRKNMSYLTLNEYGVKKTL